MNRTQRNFSTKALTALAACLVLVGPASADFVINDDLIVDGSACVGFDCVNGESFGFDTIRIKENNLRIKADDTSVAASFPRNDWQLTFNDSANGGVSKFSVDDISGGRTPFTVEANARSHSLYVDDGGRIGNRTSTPSVEIHTIDGDTPTLRLQQDGSSGFAPQTWDLAGNETNFFVRDVTNGSTLPFRIRPGAPTSSIFIDVGGDVGLGTSSPDSAFHLSRTGLVLPIFQSSDNDAIQIRLKSDSANRRFVALNSTDVVQSQIVLGDNGQFDFLGETGADLRMRIEADGDVLIAGDCMDQNDPGPAVACDAVFDPSYDLPSIEEHAALMWENKYLPQIGPTPEGKRISMSLQKRHYGMLNELEKAHIYIEQLHNRLQEETEEREDLTERLAAIEAALAHR